MTTLALYRKYRPQAFQSVIGQDPIKNTLMSMNADKNINHGFIFAGSKGTGKTTVAKIFAKAINCLNPIHGDACNECENCQLINSNSAIDILELDAASNNGVDEIRSIIDNVLYLPINLKYKVYIIDEAHMLTTGAWNALLKTLEEPPKHAIFIFATTEYAKIPATIVSRCQRYDFHKLTNQQLETLINDVCQKENIQIDHQACSEIALLADGAGRDALSILSQLAIYSNGNIHLDDVNNVFNLVDTQELINLINLLNQNQITELIQTLHNFDNKGTNWLNLTTNLMNICMDKYLLDQQVTTNLLNINLDFLNQIEMSSSECLRLANILSETLIHLKTSINPVYSFELQCLNFLNSNNKGLNEPKTIDPTKTPLTTFPVTKSTINNLSSQSQKDVVPKPTIDPSTTVQTPIQTSPMKTKSTTTKPLNFENMFQTTTRPDLANIPGSKKSINVQQVKEPQIIEYDDKKTNEPEILANQTLNPYDLLNPDKNAFRDLNQITQEIFNVIVNNQNKDLVQTYQNDLNDYLNKHQYDLNQYIGILKNISKVWVANNEGIILAFPTSNSVKEFNKALNNHEFVLILSEIFGDNKVLFAIDNTMRDNMKQAYLNAKKKNTIPNIFNKQGLVKTINLENLSIQDEIKKLLD